MFSEQLKRIYLYIFLSMCAATSFLCFDYLLFAISPFIGKSRFRQWMSIDDPRVELNRDNPAAAYDALLAYTDHENDTSS